MGNPLLEIHDISKSFPGVEALKNINLKIKSGEVRALVGENGAGKSTLVKIIAGETPPSKGMLKFNGQQMHFRSPADALDIGISMIHQELNLINDMSITQNILIGRMPSSFGGWVNDKLVVEMAKEILKIVNLEHLSPYTKINQLSVSQKQLIEVARNVSRKAKLLIMDEPTSTMTRNEIDVLFNIINRLRKENITIIYISHRLEEVFEVADTITVLRDGNLIDTMPTKSITKRQLIKLMINKELNNYYKKFNTNISDTILEVNQLTTKNIYNISFSVRKSEILGIAGLVGSGRTEIARALFGIDPIIKGNIILENNPIKPKSPIECIEQGMVWVPEDRKEQGSIISMSVLENITLPTINNFCKLGFIKYFKQKEFTKKYVEKLNIKTPSITQILSNLSGGNQQKVVIAKWLGTNPKLLFLDDPTRGIDVGAKSEIYQIIGSLVNQGLGIILVSSELPELISISDRIIVMRNGEVTARFNRNEFVQEKILSSAFGEI